MERLRTAGRRLCSTRAYRGCAPEETPLRGPPAAPRAQCSSGPSTPPYPSSLRSPGDAFERTAPSTLWIQYPSGLGTPPYPSSLRSCGDALDWSGFSTPESAARMSILPALLGGRP